MGVIDPALGQFPGPEEFQSLLGGAAQGLAESGLGGLHIDTSGNPAGDQAGNITSQFSGGHAAAPGDKGGVGKGAQGCGGSRAGLGAGFLVRGGFGRSTSTKPAKDFDGGAG